MISKVYSITSTHVYSRPVTCLVLLALVVVVGLDARVSRGAGLKMPPQPERMALWIDGKQIERFAGVPMDIYIIKNGAVVPYLQDAQFDSQLPILPAEVDSVELTWVAEREQFTYKFTDLKSLDPDSLYDPLLSIPVMGVVPKLKSVFYLSIPCTGRMTGNASMYIVLHVYNTATGERVEGSPLKFHLRKRCLAFESRKLCRHTCKNGGKCNDLGRCDCKPGYYGVKCEQAICKRACMNGGTCVEPETCKCGPSHHGDHCQLETGTCDVPCINGGTCTHLNVCSCHVGYTGQFCQKSTCKRWCGVHGKCVDVNLCECHRGWRGKLCNKTVKFADQDVKDGHLSRKKRRRKLRHSSAASTPFRFETRRNGDRMDARRRREGDVPALQREPVGQGRQR